jgi:hypothetical protein
LRYDGAENGMLCPGSCLSAGVVCFTIEKTPQFFAKYHRRTLLARIKSFQLNVKHDESFRDMVNSIIEGKIVCFEIDGAKAIVIERFRGN